jgi:hypothetical protein
MSILWPYYIEVWSQTPADNYLAVYLLIAVGVLRYSYQDVFFSEKMNRKKEKRRRRKRRGKKVDEDKANPFCHDRVILLLFCS